MVDIRPSHEEDLLLHLLTGDRVSSLRARLMAVRPLELDRTPIDIEVTPCSPKLILMSWRLTYLYLAESRIDRGTI